MRAHPRSRGENLCGGRDSRQSGGSSPLTRGKRDHVGVRAALARLIPAHAGKTDCPADCMGNKPAHPRSRGENYRLVVRIANRRGSSPLTRGKLRPAGIGTLARGLIPAHAGKTGALATTRRAVPAHPRSRGENQVSDLVSNPLEGSSPLTRGKRSQLPALGATRRLIPAHAGKTWPPL